MDKRIIYKNTSGGVSVIIPATDSGLTVEEIAAKDVPTGVAYEIIDTSDLPSDRTFRNAWRKKGRNVSEDVTAAKAIAHEKRRAMRDEEMIPLDVEATIPILSKKAEAKRQKVRDKNAALQERIDSAADVGELKKLMDV